jgi:hypothetical protein
LINDRLPPLPQSTLCNDRLSTLADVNALQTIVCKRLKNNKRCVEHRSTPLIDSFIRLPAVDLEFNFRL